MEAHNELRLQRMFVNHEKGLPSPPVKIIFEEFETGETHEEEFEHFEEARNKIDTVSDEYDAFF